MEFFFHVAPDKQFKREESSSILLLKSIFTMLSNLSDVDSYHLFNMTAVKRKSEQANMPYFSTFLTKLHKMSGNVLQLIR